MTNFCNDTVAICGRKSINFVNVFVMCEKKELETCTTTRLPAGPSMMRRPSMNIKEAKVLIFFGPVLANI